MLVIQSVTGVCAWFSSGGFEESMKPKETGMTLAQKLVQGLTEGFISGLLGVDLSPEVKKWISNAIIYANPAQVMTDLLLNAINQVKNNIIALTRVQWQSVGQEMMQGIANGINSGVSWIVSAARNAALQAYNAAKRALGIRSPSKVFEGVGEQMMAGWQQGITAGNKVTASAVTSAAGNMVNATAPVRSRAGGASIVFNYSPMMSLGDRNEAREKLLPFIRDGLRAAGVA